MNLAGLRLVLIASASAFGAEAATQNIASRGEELLTLDNGTVKVGIDRAKGGAITWLSSAAYPNTCAAECRSTAASCGS